MDSTTSAMISLIGMLFDSVGGLYLAYDLLGGEKGPLSTFTRIVTYSLIIGLAYGLSLGLRVGLLAGLGLGIPIGLQLDRLGRDQKDTPLFLTFISIVRGMGLGAAVWSLGFAKAAIVVFIVVFTASMVLPQFKISPALLVESGRRPSFNRKKLLLAVSFALLAAFIDLICIALGMAQGHTLNVFLRGTFTVVMATVLVSTISPVIEWYADHVEPRRLGYLGAILFIIGFLIQSLPSLFVVLK